MTPNAWKVGDNPFPDTCDLLPDPGGHIEWLMQRRHGIGSSDCAAALGMSRWSEATPWHLFMDKTGQFPLESADTEAAEWGRRLEPAIRQAAADRLGMQVQTVGGLANRERPWMRASLDGVLVDNGTPVILEAKNTSIYLAEEWDDQIPDAAELQVLHAMAVTGAPHAYVAGLVGGNRLVVRKVERDQELIDHIITVEAELWGRVQRYRWAQERIVDLDLYATVARALEPALTARDTVDSIVGASSATDVDEVVLDEDAAAKAHEWMDQYGDAQVLEKQAAEMKAEARNNLIRLADGHAVIAEVNPDPDSDDPTRVIARVQRGNFAKSRFIEAHPDVADVTMHKIEVLDVDALKREHPDLYRQFQSRSIRAPKKGK